MVLRKLSILSLAAMLFLLAGCHHAKVKNPIANVDSKQPDKVLFDTAMTAMQQGKYDVARLTLQTLINTYPDSEFIARAKLAIGDSWYAEGTSAALVQAENEYKDFETFFPNMPEAAEAQLKIANIHFKEMEKPDRDFTHAVRAQDEYRYLISQYPDSKLVPEAKKKLLEVQEVLAEREFRIGRFYYMREAYPAAEARLKSLVDTYPLYSDADQALLLLGDSYLKQVDQIRAIPRLDETTKGNMIKKLEDQAADAFSKVITRYPVTPGAEEAKKELIALKRPVPTPTAEAIAQNKKEEASRRELGMFARFMDNLKKGPDASIAEAATVGEPTMMDPKQTSAPDLIREAGNVGPKKGGLGKDTLAVQPVKEGAPPPSQPIPRSDAPASAPGNGISDLQTLNDAGAAGTQASTATAAGTPASTAGTAGTPASTATATAASQPPSQDAQPAATGTSSSGSDAAATPPAQVNEAAQPAASGTSSSSSSATAGTEQAQNQDDVSTSKVKKKKGLHKLVPF